MLAEIVLVLALPVVALCQNVIITAKNPLIIYEGTWFDQDSGGHETTATLGSSVSLVFPGTAIYWHATINPNCGIGNVSIDNDGGVLVDASNGTSQNDTAIPAILFSRAGLQAGISHSINITFFAHGSLGGPYMEMYNFSYTQDSIATSSKASTSSISSGSSSAGTSHKSNTGAIAGGVVGGLLGGLLIVGCILLLVRRHIQNRPRDPPTSPYTVQRPIPAPPTSKSPPSDPMSAVNISPRSLPVPQPQPESHVPQSISELTSTHNETSPPSSLSLIPNRNEPAPSIMEAPPPPYIPRSNDPAN